ncbi:hypothetical protein [Paraliomyxa miuraensis]|uniref:hypothetical protein n=1 Tax=Paraliomyxa miuraensis TaxID=376150 RepID=UPI002254966C|nr:hypothetical protein [Paraliomyxa miuraensis]MCX4248082.1 hypothetical protein [Paraliomyxa miuraensis]
MNRLVPYLDLFGRLTDDELARLAGVPASIANNLRRQVVQVDRALARFADLLPRLTDAELVRLTGAAPKTVRFWRLCQPRAAMTGGDGQGWSVSQSTEGTGRAHGLDEPLRRPPTAPHPVAVPHPAMSDETPLDSGAPLERRHYRMPTGERDAGPALRPREASGSHGLASSFPVDLSRPRTGRTQELPSQTPADEPSPGPPPELVQRQQAVSQQMTFAGAPFPGNDYSEPVEAEHESDDGIFIGLELPDPRTLR